MQRRVNLEFRETLEVLEDKISSIIALGYNVNIIKRDGTIVPIISVVGSGYDGIVVETSETSGEIINRDEIKGYNFVQERKVVDLV